MEEEKERIKDIRKKSIRRRRIKEGLVGVSTVLLVVSVAVFFWPSESPGEVDYASAGEDTVSGSSKDAAEYYDITSVGVSPASHRVELGESVGFRNKLDHDVDISFDRSDKVIELKSGESDTLLINGITYFDVEGGNYSASGRVNVQ